MAAAKAFDSGEYDFGFVHVKATDDAGHDKDEKIKVEQIEKCDKMIQTFIDNLQDKNMLICVTGDHSTPTYIGDHTFEPVPILINSLKNDIQADKVEKFDDLSCGIISEASLGRFSCQ